MDMRASFTDIQGFSIAPVSIVDRIGFLTR